MAGGLVRGDGNVSGGGGGGGRVSRRQAALSVVRQSEGFRSLEGVLVERRRYLKEMEAQVHALHACGRFVAIVVQGSIASQADSALKFLFSWKHACFVVLLSLHRPSSASDQ